MSVSLLRISIRRLVLGSALQLGLSGLGGCAVVAVADATVSAVVGVGSLAVDAAVGTARIGGKIVGATVDAVLPGDDAAE